MELIELLKTRRTYRRFKQEPIADACIDEMLTAARYASSAMNKQPLQYVVVKTPQKVKEVFSYTKWAGSLPPEQGQPKAGEEPVLFVGIVENMELASAYTDTDAGLAISNLTLAAWNHGIGSCIIGACNKQKLGELFGLSENQKLHTVVAFGYPSHTSRIIDAEGDNTQYFLDENRDYVVPKRKTKDVVTYL